MLVWLKLVIAWMPVAVNENARQRAFWSELKMNEIIEHEDKNTTNQAAMHSLMVMEQWGNKEVYNEDRWVERAKQAARKAMEGMFELGKALIVLKEHTEHGYFREITQTELGLGRAEVTRLMYATRRFATPQMQKAAPKLMDLGKSKLLELLVEEDDTLIELVEGGDLNGHTLDDVDRMTVKELRKALRESREDTEVARKVAADKDGKINQLNEKLEKSKSSKLKEPAASDVAEDLKLQLSSLMVGIESQISRLRPLVKDLIANTDETGIDHTPVIVGCINQIIRDCESVREEFVLPNEAPIDGKPEWI